MTDAQQPVVVEQCDRDAAVAYLNAIENESGVTVRAVSGNHPLLQAFARHRIAERERCVKVAEQEPLEAERFAKNLTHPSTIYTEKGRADSARNIRDAIRSGKEPAA